MSVNFLTPKNWDNATDAGRNDLVFQNRNHEYGAFVIRRDYNHHLFLALFISTGIFLSAFIIPKLLLNKNLRIQHVTPPVTQIEIPFIITPPIEKIKEIITPPATEQPAKHAATEEFIKPVVVDETAKSSLQVSETILNPGKTTTPGVIGEPITDKPIVETGTGIEKGNESIPLAVEVMPKFPGGEAALLKFLQQNTNYPVSAKENNIEGIVYVSFVIDVTGKPVMVTALNGIRGGKDLEAEAMRVIANMPHWSVGLQNNRPTPVRFNIPVKFALR